MSWLTLDDGFAENTKIADLSDRAFRLHVAAMCYSARNLTDGHLSDRGVKVACAISSATVKHVRELVSAGVWIKTSLTTYQIHDWGDYNLSAHEIRERRDKRREAGRAGGKASGRSRREASAKANAEASASANREAFAQASGFNPQPYPRENLRAVGEP